LAKARGKKTRNLSQEKSIKEKDKKGVDK